LPLECCALFFLVGKNRAIMAVMLSDFTITAFATLFVAIGSIDTAIVFGGLTAGVHRPERYRLAWQAVLIAGLVLLDFALFSNRLLGALRVSWTPFELQVVSCCCCRPSR
jgi:small neutral amino acid transporter SnatA (MarC family)